MKRTIILSLMALFSIGNLSAQQLVLMKDYGVNWNSDMVGTKNKPNGYMYRLRRDIQCDLPKVPGTEGLEIIIGEQTETGWLALFRTPMASTNYNFVAVLYDFDKKPLKVMNLCDISNNSYCEVQDIRWDDKNRFLLFNMACPSYSDMIDGKGSKLYCYQVDEERIVWETDYLVSNNIFIFNEKYVFCSYGFTHEKKRLFMLDKMTGKMYSKINMIKDVDYMEIQQQNGKDMLFVVDNRSHLYAYRINNTSASAKKAKRTARPRR